MTEAYYKTGLQTLIENDPKLQGLPLRCAAVSKLCELRIKADNFLNSMTAEEIEICARTKHVHLQHRLPLEQPKHFQPSVSKLQEDANVSLVSTLDNN